MSKRLRVPSRKASLSLVLVTAALLATLVITNGAGALTHASSASSTATTSQTLGSSDARAPSLVSSVGCDYTIFLNGTTLEARQSSGAETVDSTGSDAGAFITSLLVSHETYCVTPGDYGLSSAILIFDRGGVTLNLDPGVVMQATSNTRLLQINASPGTVIRGGEWISSGRGRVSAITIQYGSNNSVIEQTDVSRAGDNGILVYDNVRPDFNLSILDNFVHDNSRYGIQAFSSASAGITGTVISGNVALDNSAGGIYTNKVSGVNIAGNVVRNTAGNGPGRIGIGVTNGHNDTVSMNQVENMTWFGIQAYYNNNTVISDNISMFNAGGEDQSGITNDHSSFDTIVGNIVDSNGGYGVYVERSWNVTITGNTADDNLGYGVGLYHGSLPAMGRVTISGNACSFNGLGGIVLNSAVDDVISANECYNNSGDGILLYNDPGEVGSTGNLVSSNWLGNQGNAKATQEFGIAEANASDGNTLVSNMFVNNTAGAVSLVGDDAASN